MKRLAFFLFFILQVSPIGALDGSLTPVLGYPLWAGVPEFALDSSEILSPGKEKRSSVLILGNVYRRDPGALTPGNTFYFDTDVFLQSFLLKIGISPGLETRISFLQTYFYPGHMDPFLSGFHGTIKVPNQGREITPENLSRVYVASPKGVLILQEGTYGGPASLNLGLRWQWVKDLLNWSASFKVPLPNQGGFVFTSQPGFQVSLNYGDSRHWWSWGANLGIAYLEPGRAQDFFEVRRLLPSGGLRFSFQPSGEWLLTAQVVAMLSPIDVNSPYGGLFLGQSQFGGKMILGPGWELELCLLEEFASFASLEVGFQGGLSWKY